MHRVGDAIEQRRDELAHDADARPGQAAARVARRGRGAVAYWRNAAEDGKRLEGRLANSFTPGKRVLLVRRPRGVIGVITPWNWPYTMPAELIAPALASGNTVVWTPASTTAVGAVALAECVVEADLPPGVFNLVTGPGSVVGDEIARNPGTHGVGFIGSTETGRKVAEAAAGKAAVLELGGNGPGGRARGRRPRARRRGGGDARASSAPARAAPPASGCSCIAPCARSSSRWLRALVASASCSATRSPTARRWAR